MTTQPTNTQASAGVPLTKLVDWSYPTSSNATKFGYGRTGCWTVAIGPADHSKPHRAIAGFDSLDKAKTYCTELDIPAWDRLTK